MNESSVQTLNRLIDKKYKTAKNLIVSYQQSLDENAEKFYCDSTLISRYKNGKREIPENFQQWLKVESFKYLTPWGSFIVTENGASEWFQDLLFLVREGRYKGALDLAISKFDSLKKDEITKHAVQLKALIAMIFYHQRDYENTYVSYKEAFELAETNATDYVYRYETSMLNAEREMYKSWMLDSARDEDELFYNSELESILVKQNHNFRQSNNAGNQDDRLLALKHCLRLTSILNKEEEFKIYVSYFLDDGFDKTESELKNEFLELLEHDEDGDFVNALQFESVVKQKLTLVV